MDKEDVQKKEDEKKINSFRNMITNRYAAAGKDISASGAMGSITMIVGLIAFIVLCIFYIVNVSEAGNVIALIDKSIIILTLGASLLGIRKVSSVIGNKKVDGVDISDIIQDLYSEREYYKEKVRAEEEKRNKRIEELLDKDEIREMFKDRRAEDMFKEEFFSSPQEKKEKPKE